MLREGTFCKTESHSKSCNIWKTKNASLSRDISYTECGSVFQVGLCLSLSFSFVSHSPVQSFSIMERIIVQMKKTRLSYVTRIIGEMKAILTMVAGIHSFPNIQWWWDIDTRQYEMPLPPYISADIHQHLQLAIKVDTYCFCKSSCSSPIHSPCINPIPVMMNAKRIGAWINWSMNTLTVTWQIKEGMRGVKTFAMRPKLDHLSNGTTSESSLGISLSYRQSSTSMGRASEAIRHPTNRNSNASRAIQWDQRR